MFVFTPRPPPTGELGTRHQLFFQLGIWRNFPVKSISIGFQSTHRFARCGDLGIMLPVLRYPGQTCFRRTQFPLAPGRSMKFRGVCAPDPCFSHRDTSENRVSGKLDFHWFPIDQWGLETSEPQIRTPHSRLPMPTCPAAYAC